MTCWRSQSYCRLGNPKSEMHMVTIISSFLRDCVKRHFPTVRDSLANRLITHECVCLVGLVWLGWALGQRFQLLNRAIQWKKTYFPPWFCFWGNVIGGNNQQQELWCVFTRLFVATGVRYRHFPCIGSYLLAALLLSPDNSVAANKAVLVHPSLIGK